MTVELFDLLLLLCLFLLVVDLAFNLRVLNVLLLLILLLILGYLLALIFAHFHWSFFF